MRGRSPDEWVEFARQVLDIEVEGILEVKKKFRQGILQCTQITCHM